LVRALRHGHAPSGTEAPGGTSRSTSRGLTGQGPAGFRRPAPPVWRGMRTRRTFRWCRPKAAHDESFAPTRSARTPPVARSGRTRGRVWCNTAAVACRPGTSPERAGTVRLRRSRRVVPCGITWPGTTRFRGAAKPRFHGAARAKGRFTRASAKRFEIGCTRGAFHRGATRTWDTRLSPGIVGRVGPSPQVVTNLWRTRGAVARVLGWQTHAPTRLP
jgi:hypothetical protein